MRSLSTRSVVGLCAAIIAVAAVSYAIWLRPEGSNLFRVQAPEYPQAEVERERDRRRGGGRGITRRSGDMGPPTAGGVAISGSLAPATTSPSRVLSGAVPTGGPSPAPDAGGDRGRGADPASDQYSDTVSELLTRIASGR